MKLGNISFVPLNEPFQKRLDTLSIAVVLGLLTFFGLASILFTVYVLLFTKYWFISVIYLIWIWIIDKDTPNRGGRAIEWIRRLPLLRHAINYFPITVESVPGVKLDPQRNYLCCSFPHGILALGAGISSITNTFKEVYPDHKMHAITLSTNFYIPLYRDFLLSIGACSAAADSISWILKKPKGGNIVSLVVGGAAEAFYGTGGQNCLILKNRKGFIKIALRSGCHIIPTYSFGETSIFKQVIFQEESFFRTVQKKIKQVTGISPVLFYGRGIFQYTFGFVPFDKPINIICGKPIEVTKIENPTQNDIDKLHATFINKLTELFEEYKYHYLENPEKCELKIV